MAKTYVINECFYSLQGEGARAGTPNVFVRFAGCNLQCTKEVEGFNCDTDFRGGDRMDLAELLELVAKTDGRDPKLLGKPGVILTGGEPTLQIDVALVRALQAKGYKVCVETNGLRSRANCEALLHVNWISCSPKQGRPCALGLANEVRVVVKAGQVPDDHGVSADHYYVSPAFWAPKVSGMFDDWEERLHKDRPNDAAFKWAVAYCKSHPRWALSVQQHKAWRVR